ncbi:MAG TPA: NAD(P)-dependent oxidoreductase [Planctomycetota bacterium]|nr:NAD(P)-dependent oxidoreductase [Planctomycetota bacterium]
MGLRILLIGGSGFIGTRLTRRLVAAGHTVRIADLVPSPSFPQLWQHCDVTNPAGLRAVLPDIDLVYYLAAVHGDQVHPISRYYEVNVQGAENCCAAATAFNIQRIVFTSSVAVYGPSPRELDETAQPAPASEYGRTKLLAEDVFRAWQSNDPARSLTIVRPTTVFGEGNRGNLYNLFRSIATGRFLFVGSGRNIKSIAYIENVAAFLEFTAGLAPQSALFNYADKPDFTMEALVRTVRQALGRPPVVGLRIPYAVAYAGGRICDIAAWLTGRQGTITTQRIRKFTETTHYAAERARAAGFQPEVTLEEGLQRTLAAEFGAKPAC